MPSVCVLGGTCAAPLVVTGNGFTFQVPNLDPYGDDLDNTDSSCAQTETDTGSHPDVVFQVTLAAGDTLHVTDNGEADLLFHVLTGACSSATPCAESYDGGNSSEQTIGLQYLSPIAQTVFVVIDSWRDDPGPTDNVALNFEIVRCGDGIVSSLEACDDGAKVDGDGCSSSCDAEPGYICSGSPSICMLAPEASCAVPIVVTGNSFVYSGSDINAYGDDASYDAGAGCISVDDPPSGADIVFRADLTVGETVRVRELGPLDAVLHIIGGGLCAGGSACAASTDGNEVTGITYKATTAGPVYIVAEAWGDPSGPDAAFQIVIDTSICGDGVVSGSEACDDHNGVGGDGCSATCTIETGFVCDGTPSACANISACTTATCALGACTGTVVTGTATGLPAAIPDDVPTGGATLTIPIAMTGTVTKMAIRFSATHTFDADIDVSLTGPNGGAELDVSSDNGSTGDNYTNTIFRSGYTTSITSGSAPFTGIFNPETSLGVFNGQSVTGSWKLRVDDDAPSDTGSVTGWDVAFCVTP